MLSWISGKNPGATARRNSCHGAEERVIDHVRMSKYEQNIAGMPTPALENLIDT